MSFQFRVESIQYVGIYLNWVVQMVCWSRQRKEAGFHYIDIGCKTYNAAQ